MTEEPMPPAPAPAGQANTFQANKPAEEARISIDDFAKVQMKVGVVLEAEKVEGSRKLMRIKVDVGGEVRQVIAGIADAYSAADLLNRKVVIVANLKPARLMGQESNGMIVAASLEGKPYLVGVPDECPVGATLR